MRAYYGARWRARGDHSPRATAAHSCTSSSSLLSLLVFSLVRVYLETRLFFAAFSLSLSLSAIFLSAALSANSLSVRVVCVSLDSFFSLSVRRSQKVHHLLGGVARIRT